MSDPSGKTDRAIIRSIECIYVERVYDRTVVRLKEAEMSAMPAEAEPRRPGQGAVPPETRPEAAEPPVVDALPAQPSTGQPRPTQGRTANTGRVALRTSVPRTPAPRMEAPRTAAPRTAAPRTPAARTASARPTQ